MKRAGWLFIIFCLLSISSFAQVTVSPVYPTINDQITITFDATKGNAGLVGASEVYMHSGVIKEGPKSENWENVVGNWGAADGIGEMTPVNGAADQWQITLTPQSYYSLSETDTVYRLGFVFRNADASMQGKTEENGDIFYEINPGILTVSFNQPDKETVWLAKNESLSIHAKSSVTATLSLFVEGSQVATVEGTELNYSLLADTYGVKTVEVVAETANATAQDVFSLVVEKPVEVVERPAGIRDGINYITDDSVVLSLLAPLKNSVYVLGDFNDWKVLDAYQMKQTPDGERYWLGIGGLNPGQEYGFQYLVDGSVYIADPFADKVLDPDDQWIPSATYADLKPYPAEALHDDWYFNRVSVLQTAQEDYQWQVTDFQAPAKEDLVIYELLIRDFFVGDDRNYQSLIDTLGYLQNLGVNAIELLPIMEFNGNESWGYNPTFMFAVDKAYGSKNQLKEFIDEAHSRGIAVILDMVLNHNDVPAPYASMYFDFNSFKPTAENPWFNTDDKHPFGVFFDFDHESAYTQSFVDTVNHYWLNEFKFDGYRFDLSKGFTQTNSGDDVGAWSSKDDSRIALLKRMADDIWSHSPEAYIILEHFADNAEEKILSDYGMMLWGNVNHAYSVAGKGYESDLSGVDYKTRGWQNPNLVGYMESHDEERVMYRLLTEGYSTQTYNIKDTLTALDRLKLNAAFFFTIPGPKMLWQFGERGYEVSINYGGSNVANKPPQWEDWEKEAYQKLYKTYAALIKLKTSEPAFKTSDYQLNLEKGFKTIHLQDETMKVVIAGNFSAFARSAVPVFQQTGTWYDFFSGEAITVEDTGMSMNFMPGEFHIYTTTKLETPEAGIVSFEKEEEPEPDVLGLEDEKLRPIQISPNPVTDQFTVHLPGNIQQFEASLFTAFGQKVHGFSAGKINSTSEVTLNMEQFPGGVYLLRVQTERGTHTHKIIKN